MTQPVACIGWMAVASGVSPSQVKIGLIWNGDGLRPEEREKCLEETMERGGGGRRYAYSAGGEPKRRRAQGGRRQRRDEQKLGKHEVRDEERPADVEEPLRQIAHAAGADGVGRATQCDGIGFDVREEDGVSDDETDPRCQPQAGAPA